MENLRWILLVIGVLVIAGLFLYTQKKKAGGQSEHRNEPRFDDWNKVKNNLGHKDPLFVEATPEPEVSGADAAAPSGQVEPVIPVAQAAPAGKSPTQSKPVQPDLLEPAQSGHSKRLPKQLKLSALPEKIVVIQVVPRTDQKFTGKALNISFQCAGMEHGDMDIYHRLEEGASFPLFSCANLVEPGYFDKNTLDTFETPGINLFMQLPHQFDPLFSFDEMLKSAQSIAADLNGKLNDGSRCELTQQSIEHLREEMREYRHLIDLELRKQNITA